MQVQCLRVKLREGTTEQFVNWAKELYNKMDNVYEALENETMVVESIFLDRCEDGDYLVFYTRAENLVKANEAMQKSDNQVDKEAIEMIQKTWESAKPLEILFDVDRLV
jgi:tRNA A58 N-methylase Trm61